MVQTLAISVVLLLGVNVPLLRDRCDARTVHEPGDIETVSGEVVRVDVLPRAGGGGRDVTLVLRTDIGDEVPVAVGPRWVVKAMGLRLRGGDDIQVAGWRIVRGKPALLAAEIDTGAQRFLFRDRHGIAAWSARRRLERLPTRRVD